MHHLGIFLYTPGSVPRFLAIDEKVMNALVRQGMAYMLGTWLLSMPLYAQFVPPASNDIKLQVTKQEIDEDAAGRASSIYAQALAAQFKSETKVVEDLRTSKQGWGEITIRLVLAQEAYKLAPGSYPNLIQPLQRIGDLRKEKQSWGEIAKQLGVDLAPVVAEAQRVRQELRAKVKTNAGGDDRQGRGAGSGTRGLRD